MTNCSYVGVETVTTKAESADDYDSVGAMQYIVCTVIVYSIVCVLCTLIVRVRRIRSAHFYVKDQDEAVEKYHKLERHLKDETYKRHMRNEIQKHADSIAKFEEKMRLIEEERRREAERVAVLLEAGPRVKKDKHRRLSLSFLPSRRTRQHPKHRKLSLVETMNTHASLSMLFVQAGAAGGSNLQEINEEAETDIDKDTLELQKNRPVFSGSKQNKLLLRRRSEPVLETLTESDADESVIVEIEQHPGVTNATVHVEEPLVDVCESQEIVT